MDRQNLIRIVTYVMPWEIDEFDRLITTFARARHYLDDDNKVIYAMKKGLDLILTGESTRGTVTNDTYTLKGFTSAFNKLNEDC